MIKMEIRAFTIQYSKKKAKYTRDEESALLSEMIKLQYKLQTAYSDSLRSELERIKAKLTKMDFTKINDIPCIAVFLDFEKAFDSVEWDFIQKCLESFNFAVL